MQSVIRHRDENSLKIIDFSMTKFITQLGSYKELVFRHGDRHRHAMVSGYVHSLTPHRAGGRTSPLRRPINWLTGNQPGHAVSWRGSKVDPPIRAYDTSTKCLDRPNSRWQPGSPKRKEPPRSAARCVTPLAYKNKGRIWLQLSCCSPQSLHNADADAAQLGRADNADAGRQGIPYALDPLILDLGPTNGLAAPGALLPRPDHALLDPRDDHAAFELCEHARHLEHGAPRGGCRVDGLLIEVQIASDLFPCMLMFTSPDRRGAAESQKCWIERLSKCSPSSSVAPAGSGQLLPGSLDVHFKPA